MITHGDETYAVTVHKGAYAIALGETRGDREPLTPADLTGDRFLSVTIDAIELLPRQRLGAAPRAILADDAKALGGRPAADYAITSELGATYLTKTSAESTYLTTASAQSTYLTTAGAGHQTGWTALAANLVDKRARFRAG